MATKTINPLAGIRVGGVKQAPGIFTAPLVSGAPITIAQGKANLKRKRLTGEAYKQARDFARKTTGYNDTSPIWGKRMNVVLTDIETLMERIGTQIGNGDYADAEDTLQLALGLNQELQKRIATGQLIAAQS